MTDPANLQNQRARLSLLPASGVGVSLWRQCRDRMFLSMVPVVGALSLACWLGASAAVAQVIEIDNWLEPQTVNDQTNTGTGQSVEAGDANPDSVILGDFRNAWVRRAVSSGQATITTSAFERFISTGNTGNSTGRYRIFWDGRLKYTKYDGVASNATGSVPDPMGDNCFTGTSPNLTFDPQTTGDPPTGCTNPINPIGLREIPSDATTGADLSLTCRDGDAPAFFLLLDATDQGGVTYSIDVFSADNQISRGSVTVTATTEPKVFGFFASTPSSGLPDDSVLLDAVGAGGGANFSSVGAIVLSASITTTNTDVDVGTPLFFGCGMDFGDAPHAVPTEFEGEIPNVDIVGGQSYRTLSRFTGTEVESGSFSGFNIRDPEDRAFRGPHHAIGGPWLGLTREVTENGDTIIIGNDTDPEPDGQPNADATGDDLDIEITDRSYNDERGVVISALGLSEATSDSETGIGEFQTCAGITMGGPGFETTYCAEVFVSNPTEEWAQVVGWVDFNGNGAFDNRCGGVQVPDGETVRNIGPTNPIIDGTVTYARTVAGIQALDGNVPDEEAYCERSSYRVLLGDLREHGSGFYPQATGTSPVGFRQIPGAAGTCDTGAFSAGGAVNQGTSDGGAEPAAGWANGNVPPGCEGVVVLTWDLGGVTAIDGADDVPVFDQITLGESFARFRISTDPFSSGDTGCGFLQESGPTPFCFASDGEAEDHVITANQLPVSVHAFESRWSGEGLEVVWGTVSETENEGFYIWGYDGEELHLLTPEMIPSEAVDIVSPQRYQYLITDPAARSMQSLAITAVDIFGDEEMYGFFAIGGQFGREQATSPIDWASISGATEQALEQQALFGERARSNLGPVIGADFRVSEAGMHRITYEQLAAAGMDFAGVNPDHIAVTRAGKPIARFVSAQRGPIGGSRGSAAAAGNQFGPGSYIEFWGELPAIPDSLYVEEYVYRVSVDRSSAVAGRQVAQRVGAGDALPYHLGSFFLNEDNDYNMSNRLPDPWYAARLRTRPSSARMFETDVVVGPQFQPGSAGRLELVVMGGIGHQVSPAHHVRVFLNDVEVYDVKFERLSRYDIRAEIPAGLIQPGSNRVRVFLPGGTEAPSDIVYLDTIELFYPREFELRDGRLLVQEAEVGERVQVAGAPARSTPTVYAWDGSDLIQLRARERFSRDVVFRTLEEEGLQYWISTADAVLEPAMVGPVHDLDLLAEAADFLVIAHPAFMPLSESDLHPLNDFVRQRSLDGWSVRVVDVTEIQQQFGGGMPLPQAVQSFLGAASQAFDPSHVLLVGGDSYDYHDRLGLGSLSFIPTFYAATSRVRHTPADGLLADLNGNGVADLAIGRWPVRTHADLESIVTKTLDWEASVADLRSAVWVADSQDPSQPSFAGQIDRMLGTLTGSGWNEGNMSRILIDEMSVSDARHQLFDKIESGATFTGFVGHGAPSMWTFQGLLVPDDLAELRNEGRPTLISTSTCYTSYFVSPFSDTVAHRWMNGFRLDANGAPVPGSPNGAVAIHGAATLSNFAQNEFIVGQAQSGMLQGMTLGEAVRAARAAGGNRGLRDQVTNWILLGDPTLRLAD